MPSKKNSPVEESLVAKAYNAMADEYDDLQDLWYPHFFKSIASLLRSELGKAAQGETALDVGCGTGFQSFELGSLGYDVTGVDIAKDLVAKAIEKLACREGSPKIRFQVASATSLPFSDASFSVVNCCGGVLSAIQDYPKALSEISRVLKPGGRGILEVDSRWNLDLFWALADPILGGVLGFEQSFSQAWRNVAAPLNDGIDVRYPFTLLDGSTEYLYSHFFTEPEIKRLCESHGLTPKATFGIHTVTNILPSTWLAHPKFPKILQRRLRPLFKLDHWLHGVPLLRGFGNSLVVVFRKYTVR